MPEHTAILGTRAGLNLTPGSDLRMEYFPDRIINARFSTVETVSYFNMWGKPTKFSFQISLDQLKMHNDGQNRLCLVTRGEFTSLHTCGSFSMFQRPEPTDERP